MAAALLVSYPATAGARFDHDYYHATHLPLVQEKWEPHGLTGIQAMTPDDAEPVNICMVVLTFRDAAARDAAMASEDAGPVFGDIANFTDLAPVAQRLTLV